jgi:hypothetical protein
MHKPKLVLKRAIEKFIADYGFTIDKVKNPDAVRGLLNQLHPVTTNIELIRLGRSGDGGYLVPDDLVRLAACFSPGVGAESSFEADIIRRSIPCYQADGSVDAPPTPLPTLHFDKKFLGVVEDDTTTTLDAWVKASAPGNEDLLLQMDIEGAEWPVLLNVSDEVLGRFRIIVLELHGMERLLDPFAFDVISATVKRLLSTFHVVHLHPNNHVPAHVLAGLTLPRDIEATLLRRDRADATGYSSCFPHPLDAPTAPHRPDYPLPHDWYRIST